MYVLDLVDFAKLLRSGEVEHYYRDNIILEQGQMNRYVRLVMHGNADVYRDGELTYSLEEGNFISDNGLHIGIRLMGAVCGVKWESCR